MNIMIAARHFDLTEPLKSRIEQRLASLEKFSADLMEAHVVIEMEERRCKAELTLHTRTSDFFASAKSYDTYLAVDNVIRKLKKQLKAHQERLKERKQKA